MVVLQNEYVKVDIKTKGAELDSLHSKHTGIEYLWSGDAAFWNKKSPILFPIVGALKQNTYYYKNRPYQLPRHGFARDKEFKITAQSPESATFTLSHDDSTLGVYPFPFTLDVTYTVDANALHVGYVVNNMGEDNMYFSIGAHPAFRVPLEKKLFYDDYFFEFERLEDAYRWLISSEGLI